MQADRSFDMFISYASADRERVFAIADRLEQLGVAIWIDRTGIAGGAVYGAEIVEAIRHSRVILLMSSPVSLASKNVRQEIMLGWRYGVPMISLQLEPVSPPEDVAYWLEGFPWIDAGVDEQEWLGQVINVLISHGIDVERPVLEGESPVPTTQAIPSNLPVTDGLLFGREQTIREIESLLDHGRWITLTGPGGTGKTRLAIEIGRRRTPYHQGGVWFVDLAPLSSPDQVLGAIADVLPPDPGIDKSAADLIRAFCADNKRTLLIVDNFEHVSSGAAALADMLAELPDLHVLATSRMPLKTDLEWAFEISQLALPDPAHVKSAATAALNPAVALFVERAKAAKPDFVLADGNVRAIADICVRLEGLPLAIELAAARVRLLPPQVLLARLGSRLSLLSRSSGVSGRQGTLTDTIAWSYDLLTPEQQSLFRQLGVFRGATSRLSVKAVVTGGEIERDLSALIDQSLVRVVQSPAGHHERVSMLELIREFALAQLDLAGETEATSERHAGYFSDYGKERAEALATSVSGQNLARLREDDANLHAAIDWLGEAGRHIERISLLSDLYSYWLRTGRGGEAARKLEESLERAGDLPPLIDGRAAATLGRFCAMQGDAARAAAMFERALDSAAKAGDAVGQAVVYFELGRTAERQGALDAASEHYSRSALLYGQEGLMREQAEAMHSLGVLHIYRGDFPAAIAAIGESVGNFREVADLKMVAEALSDLGAAEMLGGVVENGIKHLQDSLAIFKNLDDAMAIAVLTTNLGRARQISGDLEAARTTLSEALLLTREVGDQANEAVTLYGLGLLARVMEGADRSVALLREALALAWTNDDQWLVVEILEGLVQAMIDAGAIDNAIVLHGAAIARRESAGTSINPAAQAEHEQALQRARIMTGEERFAMLFETGKAANLDEVVAGALSDQLK